MAKLHGFDYCVEYKSGKENIVADSLSRRNDEGLEKEQLYDITVVMTPWLDELKKTLNSSDWYKEQLQKVKKNELSKKYKAVKDVLYYKGKLLVDHKLLPLIQILIKEHHSTPLGGHVGVRATVKKLRQVFYWKKMKLHVEQYVKACEECQRN